MTGVASGVAQLIISAGMAKLTLQRRVRSGEGKIRIIMIEGCRLPAIHSVAG
jgi:hypothetical protein